MEKNTTKLLCIKALLIALVAVCTMIIQIPVSATQGYIHLGDSIILLASVFFGWKYGMIAGGFGSAMADILSGYAQWAPFTFIIKGIMGLIVGKIAHFEGDSTPFFTIRNVIASLVGIIWMVFGYFIGGAILKSSFATSLLSVPENIVQGIGGMIIYFVIGYAFKKIKIYKYIAIK